MMQIQTETWSARRGEFDRFLNLYNRIFRSMYVRHFSSQLHVLSSSEQ